MSQQMDSVQMLAVPDHGLHGALRYRRESQTKTITLQVALRAIDLE